MRRHPALPVSIAVAAALTLPATAATAVEPTPRPAITSMTVTTGWDQRATNTILTGTNLNQVTSVLIGTVPATRVAPSASTMVVQVPARSAGTFTVTLVTADGTTVPTTLQFTVKSFNAEVLRLTNAARATTRRCGSTTYKKVGALKASSKLDKSALAHSIDMATRNYFEHTGKGELGPRKRMEKAGQTGRRYIGENIAAGFYTPDSVVKGWIASPGHCKNLMSSHYKYLGVGYAYSDSSHYGTYWTQDFTS